jgi:Cupin superfamily protein
MMENLFGCPVNANVYLTPNGAHQAFESHFDWMDGIIVQVMGCKTWIVNSAPTAVRPMPDTVFKIHNLNYTDSLRCRVMNRRNEWESSDFHFLGNDSNFIPDSSSTEFDVKEGSLLYIPRGFTHQAATNCSRQGEGSEVISPADSDLSDVASIHVTFGLEAVTDSTVEIFLHHYISYYFEDEEKRYGESDPDNTCSRSTQQDLLDSSAASFRQGSASDFVTKSTRTLPILLLSQRGNLLRVERLSACDLAHLILHSAATSDSQQGTASRATAGQRDYIVDYDGTRVKDKARQKGPSILRQAVATTTFMARNGYQPMIDELLPDAMEYLARYLNEHTATEVVYYAILLGIDMDCLKAKGDDSGQRSSNEVKGIDGPVGEVKYPESSKNLNYVRRFITSDPVIFHTPTTPQEQAQGEGKGPDRQSDQDINKLRLLLVSEEWSIATGSHESVTNAQDFLLTLFSGLEEEEEANITCSGSRRNSNTKTDHFCPSWRRLMDTLRAHIAANSGD